MYELTPKMEQKFRSLLGDFHELFDGSRCSGHLLEELLVNSIKSDTRSKHHAIWDENTHDDNHDILVEETNGQRHYLEVKSGKISGKGVAKVLTLSGHRLGRFEGDLDRISDYLNRSVSQIVSVPYRRIEDSGGRNHLYKITYIQSKVLKGVKGADWRKIRKQFRATNELGVEFTLNPTMSWQVWWKIPYRLVVEKEEFNATPPSGFSGRLGI